MKTMKKLSIFLLTAILSLGLAGMAQANLFSGFDSSTEGWTAQGLSAPTWNATGGNPGGFIIATDNASGIGYFVAPNSWSGNWSSYINGTMSFDIKLFTAAGSVVGPDIEIYSGSNYIYWSANILPPQNTWTHFQVLLTSGNFTAVGDTFNDILANVTSFKVRGDWANGADTNGLDNVEVGSSVPIPGSVFLLVSGLVGLVGFRRKLGR